MSFSTYTHDVVAEILCVSIASMLNGGQVMGVFSCPSLMTWQPAGFWMSLTFILTSTSIFIALGYYNAFLVPDFLTAAAGETLFITWFGVRRNHVHLGQLVVTVCPLRFGNVTIHEEENFCLDSINNQLSFKGTATGYEAEPCIRSVAELTLDNF